MGTNFGTLQILFQTRKKYDAKFFYRLLLFLLVILYIKVIFDQASSEKKSDKVVMLDSISIIDNDSIFYLPYINNSYKIAKNKIIKKVYNFSEIERIINNEAAKISEMNYNKYSNKNKETLKLAILVPYRDRLDNLKIFLLNVHLLLLKQNIEEFGFYVIESTPDSIFNKGVINNIAFEIASNDHDWNCFIFHDIDLLPEIEILYKCNQKMPMHYTATLSEWSYWYNFKIKKNKKHYIMFFNNIIL